MRDDPARATQGTSHPTSLHSTCWASGQRGQRGQQNPTKNQREPLEELELPPALGFHVSALRAGLLCGRGKGKSDAGRSRDKGRRSRRSARQARSLLCALRNPD